ncbi:MAG TPA: family 1 glycosylhydrolase [Acidimicrobiales bacterium]|jgi:beta-glucosidase|nr:family 1 glycosylhydrolase [Acidimicrobiales bacterium]
MSTRDVQFPASFFWGTSTSAYQIEGGNTNSDWWRFERAEGTTAVEVCGDACDSWNRYEEDLDILASLGLNAFRLSIEWARVEPVHGTFSSDALDHYRAVLTACHERGIVPVVTMHHFTLPLWVADQGGFEHPDVARWMADYATRVGAALGDLIGVACTVNEPNIVAMMGYLLGNFPPQVKNWARFVAVNETLRACHVAVRDALRAGPGNFPIGLPLSMQEYEAVPGFEDRLDSFRDEMEDKYLRSLRGDDYVGVQCYTKVVLGPDGVVDVPGAEVTDMGYPFWPQSVEYTIRRAAAITDAPIIMTENGIGTADDAQRVRYLSEALKGVRAVLDDGVDLRGYFQWSLLDNFEWTLGYRPQFGIVAIDRTTFARTLKPSATWFADATKAFFTTA